MTQDDEELYAAYLNRKMILQMHFLVDQEFLDDSMRDDIFVSMLYVLTPPKNKQEARSFIKMVDVNFPPSIRRTIRKYFN